MKVGSGVHRPLVFRRVERQLLAEADIQRLRRPAAAVSLKPTVARGRWRQSRRIARLRWRIVQRRLALASL